MNPCSNADEIQGFLLTAQKISLFISITSNRKIKFGVKYYACYRMSLSLHGPPSCPQQHTYGTESLENSGPR